MNYSQQWTQQINSLARFVADGGVGRSVNTENLSCRENAERNRRLIVNYLRDEGAKTAKQIVAFTSIKPQSVRDALATLERHNKIAVVSRRPRQWSAVSLTAPSHK